MRFLGFFVKCERSERFSEPGGSYGGIQIGA